MYPKPKALNLIKGLDTGKPQSYRVTLYFTYEADYRSLKSKPNRNPKSTLQVTFQEPSEPQMPKP